MSTSQPFLSSPVARLVTTFPNPPLRVGVKITISTTKDFFFIFCHKIQNKH